ncbi:MAG: glycosyltransferase family 4 protein [Scytolyngbya sp. HA4215-MV1]|nr:glycosyltransferase family 4 protein [Scytolyngbya sp. HA4215-MV1]
MQSVKKIEESIVFVFLEVFEHEGGIQSYYKNFLTAYLSLEEVPNADVFILRDSSKHQKTFGSDRFRFHCFKTAFHSLGRLRLLLALICHFCFVRPKRVYCGHINLALLIQILCQLFRIPYTVLTHGKEVWVPLPVSTQKALSNAEWIWTVSRYTRDRACTVNGLQPEKVKLLPCMVDSTHFTPGLKSPKLLEKYDLAESRVLMTVTRLWRGDEYKGVDVTIKALPAIAKVFPNVKYLVIGRGDDQPRLMQLAEDLGMRDRVIFAGFVPTEELVEHYRLADAYVMPSQEGFGIVYLEALACGIPVLAGNADGSADPLQDGKLGWQVPSRDSEAVADACIEILQGSDPRCDRNWLRETALAAFDQAAFTRRLDQLIRAELSIK